MKRLIWLMCAIFTLAYLNVLFAQEINYSGTWKIDNDKSNLQGRMMERMAGMTMIIEQSGNSLKIENILQGQAGEMKIARELTIGGDPIESEGMRRGKAVVKAAWADNKKELIITTENKIEGQGRSFSMVMTDTYSLSEDGKTLIMQRKAETPRGTMDNKMVFIKQ